MAIWEALVDGEKKRLDDDGTLYLLQVFGVGLPPARRLKVRSPQQHGATDIGFRYDEREMRLGFYFNAGDPVGALDKRDELYDFWKSLEATPIQLRYTRDDNSVRQIDCYVTGVVDMPYDPNENQMGNQSFVIQVEAADPMWYDPVADSKVFTEENMLDWWLALGTIDEANVQHHVENPEQGDPMTGVAINYYAGNPYTIFFKTTITNIAPASRETAFSIAAVLFGRQTKMLLDTDGSSYTYTNEFGDTASGIFAAGEYCYFSVHPSINPNESDQYNYRDDTLIMGKGMYDGLDGTNPYSVWRMGWSSPTIGTGTPEPWTPELPFAAVYDIALSDVQRAALIEATSSDPGPSKTITYGGSFLAYPVITITGPITDPVLTNVSTGEVLDFTGVTIAEGDIYTIDCRAGEKTVTNAAGTNKIAELTAASDLATFHLGADPEVSGGANVVTLTGSGMNASTEIEISYHERFVGA